MPQSKNICSHLIVFIKDLLSDPATRGVDDIRHKVVAVASSTSVDRAESFIDNYDVPKTAKAYGSYEDLVNGMQSSLSLG